MGTCEEEEEEVVMGGEGGTPPHGMSTMEATRNQSMPKSTLCSRTLAT